MMSKYGCIDIWNIFVGNALKCIPWVMKTSKSYIHGVIIEF